MSIALLHALNDAYGAFVHPLLPRLMSNLEFSVAGAAAATTTLSLAGSVIQPFLGHLADRRGRRLMIVAGPVIGGIFLSLLGWASSFPVLLLLLLIGGFGSAAFHPPAVAVAARVTEGRGSGMRHAVFSAGGTIGHAAGPLISVSLVAWLGFRGMWVAMIPAIALALFFYPILPRGGTVERSAPSVSFGTLVRSISGPLGIVFGISAIGSFFQRIYMTIEPIVMADAGGSEIAGAGALSLYLTAQAVGALTGGFLTDRVDRRKMLIVLTLLTTPAHFLAFWFPAGSALSLTFTVMAGFTNMAMLPAIVVIAQEIAPDRAALNSGIVMGLAWAVGSAGIIAAGFLGDWIGARGAALAVSPLMLGATLLALHPALRTHGRPMEGTAAYPPPE